MSELNIEWRECGTRILLYVDNEMAGSVRLGQYCESYDGVYLNVGKCQCSTLGQAKAAMEAWALNEGVKGEHHSSV